MAIKTPVDDILRIKHVREKRAERELQKAKAFLEEKKELKRQKEEVLEKYKIWRVEEEARKFEEVLKKDVLRKKLDDVKYEIRKLKDNEVEYQAALLKAAEGVLEAQRAVEEAHERHVETIRNTQKMKEMQNALKIDILKALDRGEEKEIEESFRYKVDEKPF